jgi:predicted ATPase
MAKQAKKEVLPRLHLTNVKVERFKAAFNPEPVPLRPFNLILGRNGSGKSTLLEALQWIDGTLRQDARTALQRYFGIAPVVNVRSQDTFFQFGLTWKSDDANTLTYRVKVVQGSDGVTPLISKENLELRTPEKKKRVLLKTSEEANVRSDRPGVRIVYPSESRFMREVNDPDRLALGQAGNMLPPGTTFKDRLVLPAIKEFWENAVFLRLSTSRLAAGSPAKRKSFEPLLDEEGTNLPALLNELNRDQISDLVERIKQVLKGIEQVKVSKPRAGQQENVNYALKERMPYRGRNGSHLFDIPSWMLSEGTRRITAIFALLAHDPPPSLLCIEEVENGLDPWTVLHVLNALRSAVDAGTQVIVTSHSPWLIDHVDLQDILYVERVKGTTEYRRFADKDEAKNFAKEVPGGARYVNFNPE